MRGRHSLHLPSVRDFESVTKSVSSLTHARERTVAYPTCTHLVYGYVGVDTNADIKILDDTLVTKYNQFDQLPKQKGTDKSLVAIGGFMHAMEIVVALDNPSLFSKNAMAFLKKYSFDGIVLEFTNGWSVDYMEKYIKLVTVLKEDFKASGYVLGSVLAAERPGYEIDKVIEQVDFISVNTFDYNGPWHETPPQTPTGHGASLTDITVGNKSLDGTQPYNKHLMWGKPFRKTYISLPFYGHTWKLADPTDHKIGSPASDKGPAQPFTNLPGIIGFNEVMLKMKDGGLIMEEDKVAGSVFFYKDDLWITAEVEATIKAKTNWATTEGFGGVTVRAINYDDFNGYVTTKKHPLLTAVNEGLNKN
ncbi:unnamed protein product [Oppiella nova]|uniref:GH18 domain-containing protein n=1 Tax=Oppiella nova TaxID=334625 RepID=A0A7R9M2Z2_9ACAR|nr:unnamed protein product [Oppiella nova]CAG2169242.1 unnamed protein product [Oppiella nova]